MERRLTSCSTVITTFNRKHCVSRAVRSALNTVRGGEVIVVDDASKDGTAAFLGREFPRELSTGVLRLHTNPVNLGVTGSKNEGFKLARYGWVIFLDSDDWFCEGVGDAILAELERCMATPIVFFRCRDQYGRFVGREFDSGKELDLRTYLRHTSFGEALTAINRELIWPRLPYVAELRGYEGLGCARLIADYGKAHLSVIVARVYDKQGADRLSVSSAFMRRMPLLAKGHYTMVIEFGGRMNLLQIVSYTLKAFIFMLIGGLYRIRVSRA